MYLKGQVSLFIEIDLTCIAYKAVGRKSDQVHLITKKEHLYQYTKTSEESVTKNHLKPIIEKWQKTA